VRTRGPLRHGRAIEKIDRGFRCNEGLQRREETAAKGRMKRKRVAIGNQPGVGGSAQALLVMMMVLVLV